MKPGQRMTQGGWVNDPPPAASRALTPGEWASKHPLLWWTAVAICVLDVVLFATVGS